MDGKRTHRTKCRRCTIRDANSPSDTRSFTHFRWIRSYGAAARYYKEPCLCLYRANGPRLAADGRAGVFTQCRADCPAAVYDDESLTFFCGDCCCWWWWGGRWSDGVDSWTWSRYAPADSGPCGRVTAVTAAPRLATDSTAAVAEPASAKFCEAMAAIAPSAFDRFHERADRGDVDGLPSARQSASRKPADRPTARLHR